MFLIIVSLILAFVGAEYGSLPYLSHPMEEFVDIACTTEDKTYNVEFKVHLQQNVIESIHSYAKKRISRDEGEADSVYSYIGTIIDELNDDLRKYKVQISLNLDSYSTDKFINSVTFDHSCEVGNPIEARTEATFDELKRQFSDNVGIHLFIWGCLFSYDSVNLNSLFTNLKCGRVAGVLWRGSEETRDVIKSAIMLAITGKENIYNGAGGYSTTVLSNICDFVTGCIGMEKTELGQLVYGTHVIKYTDIASRHADSSSFEHLS